MEGKWANLQSQTVLTEQVAVWSWSMGTKRPCRRGHGLAVWGLGAGAEGLFCWWLVFPSCGRLQFAWASVGLGRVIWLVLFVFYQKEEGYVGDLL